MSGTATILRADARALPLPDASVDLIVTSPPYFALRSYQDGGEHYGEQIGAEPTPAEYIANLIDCTREWVRVLKPSGSIFCNLGDKYAQDTERSRNGLSTGLEGGKPLRDTPTTVVVPRRTNGVSRKSLMLLPERYRVAAVDQLGLIARAVMIWSKPNGLPESVTDRVRRSHEDWVCLRKTLPEEPCPPDVIEAVLAAVARHEISVKEGSAVLSGELIPADGFVHLTKMPRYYSAVDEIREPHTATASLARHRTQGRGGQPSSAARSQLPGGPMRDANDGIGFNPLGKLPGSVWEIPTEPLLVPEHLGVDHHAAFPTEWPRRLILGWSPSGICIECGEGRRPNTAMTLTRDRGGRKESVRDMGQPTSGRCTSLGRERVVGITGYSCACPNPAAPTRPAVVLDPCGGTGTTALVARALGRHGISVDRSADYCRLAKWRVNDPAQLAKAMRVPAPPVVAREQLDLFGGAA